MFTPDAPPRPVMFRFNPKQAVFQQSVADGLAVNRRLSVLPQDGVRLQSARSASPRST